MGGGLLADSDDCGRTLVRLLSRGHAVAAELQRVADILPPTLLGHGREATRLAPVLPDFVVFRSEGAVDRVARTPELIELDEESRDLHERFARRTFRMLAAIRTYAADLRRLLEDLDAGAYVSRNLEGVLGEPDGAQLLPEVVALLGAMLLVLDERLPGPAREKTLVMFYRFSVGIAEAADDLNDFPDVCRLFKGTGRPLEAELAARPPGYPELYFQRFPLPRESIQVLVGKLQTGDAYAAARHYPLPEHRSHSLSAQAALVYTILYFDVRTLESDGVAMREIVNRHFGDAWVVAYALGFTADLLAMWAPYPAAREALAAAISASSVKQLLIAHVGRLEETRQQLAEFLVEGSFSEELVMTRTSALLSCLRQANTTIRWLLLQSTTSDAALQAVFRSAPVPKERLLQVLVDTALLEEKLRGVMGPLVARRAAAWADLQKAAAERMGDLATYFSGQHALQRNVRNEDLEGWFRDKQERIEQLVFGDHEDVLALGRKIGSIARALQQVEEFHEVARQPHILHFIGEARGLLQRMVRTMNLNGGTLETVATVADLSYAWKALAAYQQSMHGLLAQSPDSVKGLRALFLKLASILESPLRRIRQAGNPAQYELVSGYYSARLVQFMRSTLQEIPRLLFGLLGQISEQTAARPDGLGSRISLQDFHAYTSGSHEARHTVGLLTNRIASLMRGIRETEVAVLGEIRVEPRAILVDGLRRELARHIEGLLTELVFTVSSQSSGPDVLGPLAAVAGKAEALRRGFEHVQDYLGVSALQLWHQEAGRVVAFLLQAEEHALLRRRLLSAEASPYHDAGGAIAFPDANALGGSVFDCGGSFVSRTAGALLVATDPRTAAGGWRGDWRDAASGEVRLDGSALELLHRAVGPPGVAAVSRYLGHRLVARVTKLLRSARDLAGQGDASSHIASARAAARSAAAGAEGAAEGAAALRAAAQRSAGAAGSSSASLASALAVVGQHQLLRKSLQGLLRLHARLEAPLASEALCALDSAGLADALELMEDDVDPQLPSVFDFLSEDGPGIDERLARFRRRTAAAGERAGLGNPARQLYAAVPEGVPLDGVDVLLALAGIASATLAASGGGASSETRGSSWSFRRRHRVRGAGGAAPAPGPAEVGGEGAWVAPAAGLATILQQLPRAQTNGVLGVVGAHLVGLCAEAAAGREAAAAEGAELAAFVGAALDFMGLPRERLAAFAPLAMLELWQAV